MRNNDTNIIDFDAAKDGGFAHTEAGAEGDLANKNPVKSDKRPRCIETNKLGEPCRGIASMADKRCVMHTTLISDEERAEFRHRGAIQSKKSMDTLKNIDLASVAGITAVLEYTANQLVSGNCDPRKAMALVSVANAALKANELSITDDLVDLKKQIKKEARARR